MRIVLAALFCAFLAGAVRAQDRDVADLVRAAFTAKDTAALRALAARDDPDPWVVAEILCSRGWFDAAEAFARAAPQLDTEKLPAYVAVRREIEPARRVRAAVTHSP